jgi:hypothetical protein
MDGDLVNLCDSAHICGKHGRGCSSALRVSIPPFPLLRFLMQNIKHRNLTSKRKGISYVVRIATDALVREVQYHA